MKILGFQITNFRLIRTFTYQFKESGLIKIRGGNEAGKSSILKALDIVFRGKKQTPHDVITHGEDSAELIADIGDYVVRRKINSDGKVSLKITNADGLTVSSSPQSFLDALVTELSFDPKEFTDKDAGAKLSYLMNSIGLDFSEIDAEIKRLTEERTVIGRAVKAFGDLPKVEKVEKVDFAELSKKKDEIVKFNQDLEKDLAGINSLDEKIVEKSKEIAELETKVAEIKQKIINKTESLRIFEENKALGLKKVEGLEPKSLDEIELKISKANETNVKFQAFEKWKIDTNLKAEKQKDWDSHTVKISEQKQLKENELKAAKMPVDGLVIKEDGLYHNDAFCENWSDSQAMGIAFKLAVARNPKLRAVLIDRGEAYDKKGLAMLEAEAKKNDIQAFITIVDSAEGAERVDDAIYMEAGEMWEPGEVAS